MNTENNDLTELANLIKSYNKYHEFFINNGIIYEEVKSLKQGIYFTNISKYSKIMIERYKEIIRTYEIIKCEFLNGYKN